MKRWLSTIAGVFVMLAGVLLTTPVRAASVAPTYVAGNPTCQDQGFALGFKPEPQNSPSGTYALPGSSGTVTVTSNGTGLVSWSSTIGIDAVIVKGGPNANVYVYNPESMGDTNLVTPMNNQEPYGLSHVEFCYDLEVQVSKTAVTSYARDWDWTIDKSADATNLLLSTGQVYPVNYTVVVGGSSSDSNYMVSGTVTVMNPDLAHSATITSITDQVSGLGMTTLLSCGVTFPYVLPAGQSLVCSYAQGLPDASARVNTATVVTSGAVGGGSGTAAVTFGAPTTETDECVNVSDNQFVLSPSQLCGGVAVLPYTYTYTQQLSYATCGEHRFVNTATLVTNDTQTTVTDSWTVTVTIPCVLGCTLTQGYWKTHADPTRKQYDSTWQLIGASGAGTTFYASGMTWLQVFNTAPKGNAYYILAHQYMAAKLNVLNGASTTPAVAVALTWANTWFGSHTPSSNLSKLEKAQVIAVASLLDNYNNGLVGPGHCSE